VANRGSTKYHFRVLHRWFPQPFVASLGNTSNLHGRIFLWRTWASAGDHRGSPTKIRLVLPHTTPLIPFPHASQDQQSVPTLDVLIFRVWGVPPSDRNADTDFLWGVYNILGRVVRGCYPPDFVFVCCEYRRDCIVLKMSNESNSIGREVHRTQNYAG